MEKQYYETVNALPTVKELREISKDRPDTFLNGALYIIDLLRPVNIKELPQWVKASERLPEKPGKYLFRSVDGYHADTAYIVVAINKDHIKKHIKSVQNPAAHEWLEKANLSNHDREVASKAWDAAQARLKHEYPDKQRSAFEWTLDEKSTPDKETYINNL